VKFFHYISKFLDSTDASVSLRNAVFALVMIAGVLYLGADLATGIIARRVGISSEWNMAFGILTTAATGSKLIGQRLAAKTTSDTPADEKKDVIE